MKVQLVRLVKEVPKAPAMPEPRASRTPTVLYMMQLRSHLAETTQPRRRLVIPIEARNALDLRALPVKILHL